MDLSARNTFVKDVALELGFGECGIASVRVLDEEKEHLNNYLKEKRNASMEYMERNIDKRLNPALLVEGAKSVISVIYNYYNSDIDNTDTPYKVSMYARGKDYHYIIKNKLRELAEKLSTEIGCHEYRVFTDSAPVMERAWAREAGLGWIGKNTCLITPKKGSWFFIGEIITTMEITEDHPIEERCGSCTRCLEACPTGALSAPGVLNANKCISYLTIEHKGEFDDDINLDFKQQIFGCDICQQVCPWNRFAAQHNEPLFNTSPEILRLEKEGFTSDAETRFRKRFKNTPLERSGEESLLRNIRHVDGSIHK